MPTTVASAVPGGGWDRRLPLAILAALVIGWTLVALWICARAPFQSGTDESIHYVAFAAAKNRWAGPGDRIKESHYPPLYFLLFAPFAGDDPAFADRYPFRSGYGELGAAAADGSYRIGPAATQPDVPPQLDALYRLAKRVSLALGLVVVLCLAATIRRLSPGPGARWAMLAGCAPLLLLPQFLYYQTLCNNDALVNACGALAVLLAVLALSDLEAGRRGRYIALSFASAAVIGLGLLTKQSAMVLLPIIPALAAARIVAASRGDRRRRTLVAAGHALALLLAAFLSGGWWLLRNQLTSGDWTGLAIQRTANPVAFLTETFPTQVDWWLNAFVKLARSYVALFAGSIYGVPDAVFLLYLALWGSAGAVLLLALLTRGAAGGAPGSRPAPVAPLRRLCLAMLASLIVSNLIAVAWYIVRVPIPYGRLMFPTLVPQYTLLALALSRAAGSRPWRLRLATLALSVALGTLFVWVFFARLAPAVRQRPERLVRLTALTRAQDLVGAIWDGTVSQPVTLPPGALIGFRVNIVRSPVPQIGSIVSAELELGEPAGPARISLPPVPLGANDATDRWTDLPLGRTLRLERPTPGVLFLSATRPSLGARWSAAAYPVSTGDATPPDSAAERHSFEIDLSASYLPSPPP